MVDWTNQEIVDIDDGIKWISIRQFTKRGSMPMNVGSLILLKRGRTKERYGQIRILEAIAKPLGEMTEEEAIGGGYTSRYAYINDQLNRFNRGISLDTVMIFYKFEVIWTDSELIEELRRQLAE